MKVKVLVTQPLFLTPWAVACRAPLSMEFSSQEYWSVLPFLSPGDLPNPGIKHQSPALQADFFFYHLSQQGSHTCCLINICRVDELIYKCYE